VKLMNSVWGVILPGAVSGIGVIWFTQIFRQLPPSLREAARLDGAGEWRVWWTLLPTLRPALVSFALIHFILAWHDHLLPLLLLSDQGRQTLPVAIASLYGSSLRYPYAALMVGSVIATLPSALLFAFGYRRFKSALADVLMH
jgi:lactose/L-arabinose transport system permease protein